MNKKPKIPPFEPEVCSDCGQTKNYALAMDKGSSHIVIALASAVERLGRNSIHLVKECLANPSSFNSQRDMLEGGYMTMRMIGNASRPRYHGLIAFGKESGEYCLTTKGYQFLRGHLIPRTAIIDKVKSVNAGYYLPAGEVGINDLLKEEPYWDGTAKRIELLDPAFNLALL